MEEHSSPPEPVPPSTIRRNPPRRARHTPFVPASLARFNASSSAAAAAATITPFCLDDESETLPPSSPPALSSSKPADSGPVSSPYSSTNLNVFLRIRPDEIKTHQRPHPSTKTINPRSRSKKSPQKAKKKKTEPCLAVTGPGSVTLTIPKAKLIDSKRGTKNEIYDGFSFVFPPESQQNDVYGKVMDPLVMDFIGGKSSLLVAMGPTGSGKTHTMFGTNRDPGLVPLALKKIFSSSDGQQNPNHQRSFYLAMVEIYSTSGKGEKMIDLLSAGTELTLVQTTIKGLEEVPVSNLEEAERFLLKGMSKRCTAATDANSQSSRSQCIITIRRAKDCFYSGNDSSFGNAVLMIADLAGAERERKTGNLGSRLGESNFINNTSMVFGLCLRSLLEHQKNPKRAFQKHYKDSLLTRYLKDYLEGKKKMTLILTVKRGEEDYMDTSFVLRQASPYMKIKYTNLEENNGPPVPKRSSVSLVLQENKKRRKVGEKVLADSNDTAEISEKVIGEPKSSSTSPKPSEMTNTIPYNELLIELEKAKRNEEMMTNIAKAFWKYLNLYKKKLKSDQDVNSMRDTLKEKDKEIMELKEELNNLRQNNTVSHSEIGLESEVSENLKEYEGYACVDSSTACDSKREIGSRDSDDVSSIVVTESDLPSKDQNETVLYEDQISDDEKYVNQLEQKQKQEFLTVTDEVNNDPLEETDEADAVNRSSLNFQQTSQDIEVCIVVKDQQLDVTCERAGKSANIEESEQQDMSSNLDELNQEISSNSNLEELQQEKSGASAEVLQEEKITDQNEEIKEEIIELTGQNENEEIKEEIIDLQDRNSTSSLNLQENFEIQEEKIANFEDLEYLMQEKSANIEEIKEEISDNREEIKEEISDNTEEIKQEAIAGQNEEIKEEIGAAESEEIKEEIIISPVAVESPQSESTIDNLSDNSEEKSSIERRKNRQPIENLIETIGKENFASSNPAKANKPKRRLLPASSMLLKEFTGPDSDADILKEVRGKASTEEKARSEGSMSLIQILTAKPKLIRDKN